MRLWEEFTFTTQHLQLWFVRKCTFTSNYWSINSLKWAFTCDNFSVNLRRIKAFGVKKGESVHKFSRFANHNLLIYCNSYKAAQYVSKLILLQLYKAISLSHMCKSSVSLMISLVLFHLILISHLSLVFTRFDKKKQWFPPILLQFCGSLIVVFCIIVMKVTKNCNKNKKSYIFSSHQPALLSHFPNYYHIIWE